MPVATKDHFFSEETLDWLKWFATYELNDNQRLTFAEKLLPLLAPVFEPYDLTDEEFELTPDYTRLYTELTGAVAIYIEQYGVQ